MTPQNFSFLSPPPLRKIRVALLYSGQLYFLQLWNNLVIIATDCCCGNETDSELPSNTAG